VGAVEYETLKEEPATAGRETTKRVQEKPQKAEQAEGVKEKKNSKISQHIEENLAQKGIT